MITVVIPTFNREATIARAIESVIDQTYENWELLIVDDGSKDRTKEIIKEKYNTDVRVRIFDRPEERPKGANACRNLGIEKANGRYVAFLDSDDEWKPEHLETCAKIAENEKQFYGCYSGAMIKRWKLSFIRESRTIREGETAIDFLLSGGFSPTPSLFMSRRCAVEIKFDESLQRHQDWDFFIRFHKKYTWMYNSSLNVIVNWQMDPILKRVDFQSCILFYQRHKHKIMKGGNKKKYLYGKYKQAVVRGAKEAAAFYKKELKKNGVSNHLPIKNPNLFRFSEHLKSKLQIYRIRKIAKFILKSR